MHILYGKPCEHGLVAGATGMFAWVAHTPRLLEVLNADLVVMAALERKFVRALVEKRSKRPILFFPGFASTQLIAWKAKRCVGTTYVRAGPGVAIKGSLVRRTSVVAAAVGARCSGSRSATACGSTSKRCCTTTSLRSGAGSSACPSTFSSRPIRSTASCGLRKVTCHWIHNRCGVQCLPLCAPARVRSLGPRAQLVPSARVRAERPVCDPNQVRFGCSWTQA